MRVMMPGQADAVELRLIEGGWMGESGAALEIGAIMGKAAPVTDQVRRAVPVEAPLVYARTN